MAQIAFILLCHKDARGVVKQAERLTATGDCVAIHFDGRSPRQDYEAIRAALKDNPRVTFPRRRIKCGWGEWSLVAATITTLKAALEAFPAATHCYMLSGDCMPIKSADYAHALLDAEEVDYIESFDFHRSGWIKTGMREDRLVYRHWFNERSQKWLFYTSYELQKRFDLKRRIPDDIQMMIGSQWWCLRRRTAEAILDFCKERPDVLRFFRTTWIPDETFFQTLVRHLVPREEIRSRTLTFLMFTDYGMPVTFYNDQYDLLLGQDYLFARKVSADAIDLRRRLGELWASGRTDFRISDEGRSLHRFLTGRGRIGRRFARRFWETKASLGRERELHIVTCKKWHVAKRLIELAGQATDMPMIAYLFDEEATPLPDLGGIERTLAKRGRHRRAVLRMIFDHYQSQRLLICLDPANIGIMRDLHADAGRVRMLEIDCNFSDDYLIGHARRVGLAGQNTPDETIARFLTTIRYDVRFESGRTRDEGFPDFHRMREDATAEENAVPLAAFLGIPEDKAREIAATPYLYAD